AAERDREPGHAAGGVEASRVAVEQHAQVVAALLDELVQRRVVGDELGAVRRPRLVVLAHALDARVELRDLDAVPRQHVYGYDEAVAGVERERVMPAGRVDDDLGQPRRAVLLPELEAAVAVHL